MEGLDDDPVTDHRSLENERGSEGAAPNNGCLGGGDIYAGRAARRRRPAQEDSSCVAIKFRRVAFPILLLCLINYLGASLCPQPYYHFISAGLPPC